jgi:uncharacterized protein YjiS (DUF1127 family)
MFVNALIGSLRRAFNRWQADRIERAVFRELLGMGPHMLDDIGLSINDVASAIDAGRRELRHDDRLAALEALRTRDEPPPPIVPRLARRT